MSIVTEARQLENRAAELESRAEEMDVEQHVYFNPRRHSYWNVDERIEKYRAKARQLREQARQLRRANA